MKSSKDSCLSLIFIFYILIFIVRLAEYFILRTDQSIIGEAIIHKIIGIVFLGFALKIKGYSWNDIGFVKSDFFKYTLAGLVFGIGIFVTAYGVEMLILYFKGVEPYIKLFVTSYSIVGNRVLETSFTILIICIVGNVVNVIMEEGIFRGLFNKVVNKKNSFIFSIIISSTLFGLWHIVQPIRNVIDGTQSIEGGIGYSIMLILTSGLLGIQYSLISKVTGSIWFAISAHFVNNTSANLIHIVTDTGVDELQVLRIAIAQTLSFVIILVIFLHKNHYNPKNQI